MLQKPVLANQIKTLLNSNRFWSKMYYDNTSGAMDAALKLGFDANWAIYALMKLNKDPLASVGWSWNDPYGRVWDLGADEDGSINVNYSRALCDTEEKWEKWVEEKAPLFEMMLRNVAAFHKKLVKNYGDRIYPVGYAAPGIFENSWQPIGFVNFTKLIYQKPEFVKKVIAFQTDLCLRNLEAVMKSDLEVVLGGDDLGQKTGPLMRPELIEKLYGESYRRVADLVHQHKKKFVFHCCGNIYRPAEQVRRVGLRWHHHHGADGGHGFGQGPGAGGAQAGPDRQPGCVLSGGERHAAGSGRRGQEGDTRCRPRRGIHSVDVALPSGGGPGPAEVDGGCGAQVWEVSHRGLGDRVVPPEAGIQMSGECSHESRSTP